MIMPIEQVYYTARLAMPDGAIEPAACHVTTNRYAERYRRA